MTELSQNELEAIRDHPLKFENFRSKNANLIDRLTSEASDTGKRTYGFTRLLIEDRRERNHIKFYRDASD